MYTLKFENEKYFIVKPNGQLELNILGAPVCFYSEGYAQIALEARNTKHVKRTTTVKGVVDNRHRNWRKRGF